MSTRRLTDIRPWRRTIKPIVSFPLLLAAAATIVLGELLLIFITPHVVERYRNQLERADLLLNYPSIVLREYESLQMIPPKIGVLYRGQLTPKPPEFEALFTRLLALNDAARLRLLQEKAVSEDTLLALLGRCYVGGAQESRLEELIVRAVPHFEDARYLADLVATKLYRNYFYAGERAQYAGLIDDARRSYRRFVQLARMLNRDAALGVEMHRHLNRANVRLKILAAEHAFETEAMRKIQDGPADVTISFLDHHDPRLAALARYSAASFLWHEARGDEAAALLEGAQEKCGVLAVECQFLLAKITNSLADADDSADPALARKASMLLDDLIGRLPDDHPLLDDIYFHRAIVAQHREDTADAGVELDELQRRCPGTDLIADVKFLRDQLSGRFPMDEFYE